jgi:hypothetical protein
MKVRSDIKPSSIFSEENVSSRSNLFRIAQRDRFKALFSIVVWPYLKSKLDEKHLVLSQTLDPQNVIFDAFI